jgi:hypothetical protein
MTIQNSDAARALASQRKQVTRACATCGELLFGTRRLRFCSAPCRQRAHRAQRVVERARAASRTDSVSARPDPLLDEGAPHPLPADTTGRQIPSASIAAQLTGWLLDEWPEVVVSATMRRMTRRGAPKRRRCDGCRTWIALPTARQRWCSPACKHRAVRARKLQRRLDAVMWYPRPP